MPTPTPATRTSCVRSAPAAARRRARSASGWRPSSPTLVVSSPLLRARETAAAIARAAGAELRIDERLAPGAAADDVLAAVEGAGETVVTVGHQPDCSEIALALAGADPGFPTARLLRAGRQLSRRSRSAPPGGVPLHQLDPVAEHRAARLVQLAELLADPAEERRRLLVPGSPAADEVEPLLRRHQVAEEELEQALVADLVRSPPSPRATRRARDARASSGGRPGAARVRAAPRASRRGPPPRGAAARGRSGRSSRPRRSASTDP